VPNLIKHPVIDGNKECGSCGLFKPVSEFAKARNHYEADCRPCRKVYAAAYRKRPEVILKSAEYHKQYMRIRENRERTNANSRKRNKRTDVRAKRNQDRRAWSSKQKSRAVAYKGGKCACCGYSECLAAMDFHHKNPAEKDGYGTGALKAHWSWERNRRELDKCILVCVRCHREIHAGARIL